MKLLYKYCQLSKEARQEAVNNNYAVMVTDDPSYTKSLSRNFLNSNDQEYLYDEEGKYIISTDDFLNHRDNDNFYELNGEWYCLKRRWTQSEIIEILESLVEEEHVNGCDQNNCAMQVCFNAGYSLWAIQLFSGTGASSEKFNYLYGLLGKRFYQQAENERKEFVEVTPYIECLDCGSTLWDTDHGEGCANCAENKYTTPILYTKALNKGELKDNKHKRVCGIDDTTSIWKSKYGYYWFESFDGRVSNKFFETEKEAKADFGS